MDLTVTDANREHLVEWLKDRSQFNIWFVSIITASFMGLTFFGDKPGFENMQQTYLAVALLLLLASLILNFTSAWSIPTWRLKLASGQIQNAARMYYELATISWIAVFLFVAALTLGFISNLKL